MPTDAVIRYGMEPEEFRKLEADVVRLLNVIKRIDAINDNPAHFNSEINKVCDEILCPHLQSE